MKKQWKIKNILFTLIICLAILPIILSGVIAIYSNIKLIFKDFRINGAVLNNIAVDLIEDKMEFYKNSIETIEKKSNFNDVNDIKRGLEVITQSEKSILNAYFYDDDGSFIQGLNDDSLENFDPKESDWYKDAVSNKGNIIDCSPYIDELTGKYVYSIYKSIVKDNIVLGVIGINIDLEELSIDLKPIKYGEEGEIIILDKDGLIIFNNDTSQIGSDEISKNPIWEDISSKAEGEFKFKYKDSGYRGLYTTYSETGWKVVLLMPRSEIQATESETISLILVFLLIMLCIDFFLGTKAVKVMTKTIQSLRDGLHKMENGQLNEEVKLYGNVKEFTDLENSYNKMIRNISKTIKSFDNSVKVINNNVQSSVSKSEDISEAVSQVAKTINEIAEGTAESSTSLVNITENMTSLSEAVNNINNSTNETNEMANRTNELGAKGISIVKTVMDKSHETEKSTEEVQDAVNRVSDSIVKIKDINETISEITKQTKLLALNAAIEASRAGEAGKGFAVVSGQIRKLAEETAISAKEITNIIKEIDEVSKMAVIKAANTEEAVKDQQKSVIESRSIFESIVTSIDELTDKINKITEEISTIGLMKDSVLNKVESLSAALEETAAGSEEVTASAEEVDASIKEFVETFNEFDNMASELKEQISQFKF